MVIFKHEIKRKKFDVNKVNAIAVKCLKYYKNSN